MPHTRHLFQQSEQQLLVGFVPDFFFDKSGQVTAVFGFPFESIADTAAFGVGNAFGDLGGHRFFVLDVIESVIHFLFLLNFCVNANQISTRHLIVYSKKINSQVIFGKKVKKKRIFFIFMQFYNILMKNYFGYLNF